MLLVVIEVGLEQGSTSSWPSIDQGLRLIGKKGVYSRHKVTIINFHHIIILSNNLTLYFSLKKKEKNMDKNSVKLLHWIKNKK